MTTKRTPNFVTVSTVITESIRIKFAKKARANNRSVAGEMRHLINEYVTAKEAK